MTSGSHQPACSSRTATARTPLAPISAAAMVAPMTMARRAGQRFKRRRLQSVKVTICRTTATNNPVKLTFPLITGKVAVRTTCDVWAMAIAYLSGAATSNQSVSGQSDPWLAGMPNGTTASDNDQSPAQNPLSVMNVTPGQILSFTNVSGGVKHDPSLGDDSAGGDATQMHSHNDDDPLNEPAVQNGIGDIKAPIDAMIGLFLGPNVPSTQTPPSVTRDYTTQASRDTPQTTDLQSQQPFYIGTGKTSGGTTQTFVVPPGATRLYLGTMDGHQWANNSGSFAVTVNLQQQILLVK